MKKKIDPINEHLAEAERLAQLPREDQREIIALHRSIASNPKVPKVERQAGMERPKALERLLGLKAKARAKPTRKPAKARSK